MNNARTSTQTNQNFLAGFKDAFDSLTGPRQLVDAYRPAFIFGFILITLAMISVVWATQLVGGITNPVKVDEGGHVVGRLIKSSTEVGQISATAAAAAASVTASYRQAVYVLIAAVVVITAIAVGAVTFLNSRLVNARRQLTRQRSEMGTTNRVKERFLSSASHELNTPITVATALTDVLTKNRDGNLTERQLAQLAVVQRNNKRLTDIVDSMIRTSASGIYQGLRSESINYTEFVESTVANMRKDIEPQGIQIETSISNSDDFVNIDPERVEQALSGLITNAVQHSAEGAVVLVSIENQGNSIKTCVQDSGTGIAEQDRDHVFSPFYRSDSERTRRLRGLGLGLTMVKRIIEGHGGEVGFEPNKGDVGVTFCFTLPIAS